MLIDDDRNEAVFWRHIIETSFKHALSLSWYDSVDGALGDLDSYCPDTVILDNKVPPYDTAAFGLSELTKRKYTGKVFVWSFTDTQQLRKILQDWPDIEILAKNDYIGFKVRDLIEQRLA